MTICKRHFDQLCSNETYTVHVDDHDNENVAEIVDADVVDATDNADVHVACHDWNVSFCMYGKELNVEIDTGVRCNIIDKATVANL